MDATLAGIEDQFPNEIKLMIVQFLPRRDRWMASRVSREWRRVSHSVLGCDMEFTEALRMLSALNHNRSVRG